MVAPGPAACHHPSPPITRRMTRARSAGITVEDLATITTQLDYYTEVLGPVATGTQAAGPR
jgi:hypothetical protein